MSGQFGDLLIRDAHESAIWPVGFGPRFGDARLVASSGNPEAPGLALWDAYTGALRWRSSGEAGVFAISLAPTRSGIIMAVATEEGITLFDVPAGEVQVESASARRIEVGGAPIWCVATGVLSDGEAFFAGAGHDGAIYRWAVDTGSPIGSPLMGHGISAKGIDVVSRPGPNSLIVSGDEEGVVLRWDAETGELIGDPLYTGGERISAGVTPGSARYFASSDYRGDVRVWDALSGVQIGRDIAMGGYPTGLALWDVSGSLHVASVSDADAVVRRWDVQTGRCLGDITTGCSVVAGQLECGAVVLAIGTIDGSVRVVRMC